MFTFKKWQTQLLQVLCGLYLLCVAYICFTPRFPVSVQLGSYPDLHALTYGHASIVYLPLIELGTLGFWLNVVMTMPLGGFISLLNRRYLSFWQVLGIGLLTGLFIEMGQFFLDNWLNFQRTVDVNDVMSNLIGVVIGYYIVRYGEGRIYKWLKSFKS
ncbi:VanZ family protein [Nicoliella lavandulae]|uniref:VanZ family protein n=1 Tax=Nicoliella lavandulae TaxID=3082954 RepID=A0ABU8SJ10_9LACO